MAETTHPQEMPPPAVMLQMISGFWVSRMIYIAAKLGIADLVSDGPKTPAELAPATKTHAPSLYRILRALASVGIFTEDAQGRFAETPLSETLRTDAPGTLRWFAISELGQEHFHGWGNLMHSVNTGGIAFDDHYKQNAWEYYARNPEDASIFNLSMRGLTQMSNQAILQGYDFSGIGKLVDVAGGTGSLLGAVLEAYPAMKGVLFDLPHVIAEAAVHDRCELVSGDFFQSVPAGGDACLLKFIIHDWDDERSVAILKNCHRAMNENGRLLLVEMVIPEGNDASWSKLLDINMLVMTGGRERTEAEYTALLARAGFRLTRIVPTESIFCIIEAVRS